MHPIVGW